MEKLILKNSTHFLKISKRFYRIKSYFSLVFFLININILDMALLEIIAVCKLPSLLWEDVVLAFL